MQVGVVRQLDDGPEVTARVVHVLDAARRAGGVRVYFTRYMSPPAELTGSHVRTAMTWQHKDRVGDVVSGPFLRGSPEFELVPELWGQATRRRSSTSCRCPHSRGHCSSSLSATRQITAFAIVGVAMEVGLEPTVRYGADQA